MIIKKGRLAYRGRGQIRIIGGKWRGRKLSVCNYNNIGLRPTASRFRETLFNWLNPVIKDARCLDCFSGSGALAIEALSRNASYATLIELDRFVAVNLIDKLVKFKEKNAEVINNNALIYLAQAHAGKTTYDIIFLDPPFHQQYLLQQTASLLEQKCWLNRNSLIYVEAEFNTDLSVLPENWYVYRRQLTRKVVYCLYIRYNKHN